MKLASHRSLSLRYKLPIWGAILIAVTTIAISLSVMWGAYGKVRENILVNAQVVARSVELTLLSALKNDDIWHAYQIMAWLADVPHAQDSSGLHPSILLVVDGDQRILISAQPKQYPMFAALKDISPEFGQIASVLQEASTADMMEIDVPDSEYFHFAQRLTPDGVTLIISYPYQVLTDRFDMIASKSVVSGLWTLLLLLPLSWYWGRKISQPLVDVAGRIRSLSTTPMQKPAPVISSHQDEAGQLYDAYLWMLEELAAKKLLQDQVVRSERLAAVGQLAAGVAHEINNPLSGMLTAIDTLKEYGQGDFRTMKTIGLLERGLVQIREIVGALLVQANVKGRHLGREDVEDVRLLIKLQADKKHLEFSVTDKMPDSVPIAATVARQIMINLLLNAVQAAPDHGHVMLEVAAADAVLTIVVSNDGDPISPERLQGIFEPFPPQGRAGRGLGLWITYQIVSQLQGRIHVERLEDITRFSVNLPLVTPP